MCNHINPDRTINFIGRTRKCIMCLNGNEVKYMANCTGCKGDGKVFRKGRKYKCKTCHGVGYHRLREPEIVGTCKICNGTQMVQLTAYDTVSDEEMEWIFNNLFNFEKPYDKSFSSFNEGYLGMGIVCGVTDYGRYKSMTTEQFKEEVKETFMRGYNQYVSIINKVDGKLPLEILIRKGSTGWNAYPIYE